MIGRGLVIFRHADGRNELHFVDPWGMAFGMGEADFEEKIKKAARENKWKPEGVVDDAEVERIKKATNLLGGPGYHEYASDCVSVINVTEEDLVLTLCQAAQLYSEIMEAAKRKAMGEIRKILRKHHLKVKDVKAEVSRRKNG